MLCDAVCLFLPSGFVVRHTIWGLHIRPAAELEIVNSHSKVFLEKAGSSSYCTEGSGSFDCHVVDMVIVLQLVVKLETK